MIKSLLGGLVAATALVMLSSTAMADPEIVSGPARRTGLLRALGGRNQVLQVPEEGRPLPHRARQRLHRQHLAHPDDPDRQGLRRRSLTSPPSSRNSRSSRSERTWRRRSAAINNFIDQGYDAIIVNANSTAAFGSVMKKANEAGVVLLSFDNIIDDPMNIQINVDQKGLGRLAGELPAQERTADPGKFLFVRGPAGQPVDAARAEGFHAALDRFGPQARSDRGEGKWDPGDAQKVTADAIAAGGVFDGIYVEGGTQGAAQAMLDAGKFIVPMAAKTRTRSGSYATTTTTRACTARPAAPALPSRRSRSRPLLPR